MAAADRHLLFGLIALQVGLVDQEQLVAAFRAWARDNGRPLSEYLADLDDEQRAAVEAMVGLHLKKHSGDVEKSLAAVGADVSNRGDLGMLGDLWLGTTFVRPPTGPGSTRRDGEADPDRTADYSVGAATSDGQRFRVLRPHARGGLGAVFVALDNELHREVALKQILDGHADDPASRARFLLEAEVTGGLEHPGIVPVYGLGAHADGRPFYAMRFIRGDNLKEAIDRFRADEATKADAGGRSLELRKLLRRFLDVCNAIDYAHGRGVLHRDIKPWNVIVGKHGETLVVDWGLAKATGKSDPSVGERTLVPRGSGGGPETLPGSALGTPGYMSPEQARGDLDRLGPRSDVYSLGATLYCLLTGRAPFEGDDVGEVLGRVEAGDFPPPRRLDPGIDPALEAVCLKAMATQPAGRYDSPRALSDDLERWMADEPVSAWREPWTRKAARWLGRHRTGVTAAAATVLAGFAGLWAVLGVQSVANARLYASLTRETASKEALAEANTELGRSKAAVQARYELAVEAIKAFHTGVSEDFLIREDRFKGLRDRLLSSASDFYGKLGASLGKETDLSSRRALAQSNFELAELTRRVGRPQDALTAHREVLAAREALAAEPGADAGAKADVARSLSAIAYLLNWTGKNEEALATFRRSESLLTDLAEADPSARAALAACRTRMSRILLDAGKTAEALEACKQARADQEMLASAPGASVDARRSLADTLFELGIVLTRMGRREEAIHEFRATEDIQQRLVDEHPDVPDFRRVLANAHYHLGDAMMMTGALVEAEAEFRVAIGIGQGLAVEFPAVTVPRRNLAVCRFMYGDLLLWTGRSAEAEAEYRGATAILEKLEDDDPAVTDFRYTLATCHREVGIVLLERGEPVEAETECRTALAIVQKLADDSPAVVDFRDEFILALWQLGDAVRALGRPAEARDLYQRVIALVGSGSQDSAASYFARRTLFSMLWRCGLTLRDLGDPAGAAADVRRALNLYDLTKESPDNFTGACCYAVMADLAGRDGSGIPASEREAAAAKAMDMLRGLLSFDYRNANQLRTESALDSLRSRSDFPLLMMDATFPLDAFERDR
jgi:serine/threonine-protein kinase